MRQRNITVAAVACFCTAALYIPNPPSVASSPSVPALMQESEPTFSAEAFSAAPSSSVVVAATETTTTTREEDGSLRLEAFAAPVNYLNENDEWQAIDTSLELQSDQQAFEPQATSYQAAIPTDGSNALEFSAGEVFISTTMLGLDGAPSVVGDTASFAEVEGAQAVRYTAEENGLKEEIILGEEPEDSAQLEYKFIVTTSPGARAALDADGSVGFYDSTDSLVARIPRGLMTDAREPDKAVSRSVDYELSKRDDSSWLLRVQPNMQWLRSPARVYPVVVDPTLTTYGVTRDCWIRTSTPTTSYCGPASEYLKVGRDGSDADLRGLLDFSVSSVPSNAVISNASIKLYLDHTQTPTNQTTDYAFFTPDRNFNASATWNNSGAAGPWSGGNVSGVAYGATTLTGTTNSGYRTFSGNLNQVVRGWVNGTVPHRGLVLKQHGGAVNNVLHFWSADGAAPSQRPTLVVNYTVPNRAPSAPAISADPCLAGCAGTEIVVDGTTPTFHVVASDDSAGPLSYALRIQSAAGQLLTGTVLTAPPSQLVSWTVPPGYLFDEAAVQLKVVVKDSAGVETVAYRALGVVDSALSPIPETTDEYGLTDAERYVIEAVADEDSLSIPAAVAAESWADQFSQLADSLRRAFPESYAYAEKLNGTTARVIFKGSVPAEVHAMVDEVPATVELFDTAAVSDLEMADLTSDTKDAILGRIGTNVNLVLSYNWETERVEAALSDYTGPKSRQQIQDESANDVESLNSDMAGLDLTVLGTDDGPAADPQIRGGERISEQDDGDVFCTSGWAATDGTGSSRVGGVLTARHCRNTLFWISANTDSGRKNLAAPTTITAEKDGDIQFQRAINGERPSPYFYFKREYSASRQEFVNFFAPVSGRRRPPNGTMICLFGRTTLGKKDDGKRTCSRVYRQSVDAHYKDGNFDFLRLTAVADKVSKNGDSGGPWFDGNKAVGINSGTAFIGSFLFGRRVTVFTNVGNIIDSSSVELVYAP